MIVPEVEDLAGVLRKKAWPVEGWVEDGRHSRRTFTEGESIKHRGIGFELDILPYSLSEAAFHLRRLAEQSHQLVNSEMAAGLSPEVITAVPVELRNAMAFSVDGYVGAARRAQNALLPYLSRGLGISVKKSLAGEVKKIQAGTSRLDGNISAHLLTYWEASGRTLKDYRDLLEHRVVVSSDARLFKTADGAVALFLALPNNPEAARPGEVSFIPPVLAWPYCWEAFVHLIIAVKEVCVRILTILDPGPSRVVSMGFEAGIDVKGVRGYFPPSQADVLEQLEEVARYDLEAEGGPAG